MNLSKIDYDYYHDTYNYYFVISYNLEGHSPFENFFLKSS